jgi:hypothetical protein
MSGTGTLGAFDTERALTLNHLPMKGDLWLPLSVSDARAVLDFSASLRSKAKSWKLLRLIQTSPESRFSFKTRSRSASILTLLSSLIPSCQTGKPETGVASNVGDRYEVNRPWFHGHNRKARNAGLFHWRNMKNTTAATEQDNQAFRDWVISGLPQFTQKDLELLFGRIEHSEPKPNVIHVDV